MKRLKCLECENDFACKATLINHLKNVHKISRIEYENKHNLTLNKKINKINKDEVISEFTERYKNGQSLRYTDIKNENPLLIYRIEKVFKNVNNLCDYLGISKEERIKCGVGKSGSLLPEDEIVSRLDYLKSIGRLSTNSMRTEFKDLRLETAIKTRYGSVEEGLKKLGYEKDTVTWDEIKIKEKINYYHSKGIDLSYSNMINVDASLVSSATNHLKAGWNEILVNFGVKFEPKRRKFSKEFLKNKAMEYFDIHGTINSSLVDSYDRSIGFGIREYFGSYESLLIELGLNPDEHLYHLNDLSDIGFKFERTFKKIVDALGIKHKYNKYIGGLRPDFQLENKVFLDCKLSSWSAFKDGTFDKYLPLCERLIIVYSRGKEIENAPEGVELRHVSYYFDALKEINRYDLINEISEIDNNILALNN